jgi:hypothetical protein
LFLGRKEPVLSSDVARVLRQTIRAEDLSANRADKPPLGWITAAKKIPKSG